MRRELTNKLDEVADDIYWDGYADGITEYKELVMNYMKENNFNFNRSMLDALEWELIDMYDIPTELNTKPLETEKIEFIGDRSMFEQLLNILGGKGR
jgi:predicted house-cleaning noncanonical NTP pyrophosphatase (MazG superfamily)